MPFDYDLIVLGGGSGGMSCAKQAASSGARVALFDFVKPSTQGTTWGLGGTCVNVGCVPKKIMHYAALLGQGLHDASSLGWAVAQKHTHNWATLVETVTSLVQQLNFRYRVALKSKDVDYINALAEFGEDQHTVQYREKHTSELKFLRARYIVIATGGRPYVPPDVPGAMDYAITSDDIFFLDRSPGKTLCVGGGYIALECAGFLTELGYDVAIAARSTLLRGFDRQCADKLRCGLEDLGVSINTHTEVTDISRTADNKLQVVLQDSNGTERAEKFDTVLYATGRVADVRCLGLHRVGVDYDERTGKLYVDECEGTNVPTIFAVGDVVQGKQELTPVAVKTGELLAKRLFGGTNQKMDTTYVPTTIFTPMEYGCVGLTEEEAIAKYGEGDIEVYCSEFTTLELAAVHRVKHAKHGEEVDMGHNSLSKLICVKSLNYLVVGFHFVGLNAGEVTQGYALAVKLGALKTDFDYMVGIHPTDAESFCSLKITKRSGVSFSDVGGCG
ncbi:FAD-binding protein, partial [archaeon]